MSLFVVDPKKCNRDGICVATCPAHIIEMKDAGTVPSPIPDAEVYCIQCGHCVAVCPSGAMALSDMKPEDCTPIKKALHSTLDQVDQYLRSRRSIRTYTDQDVDRESIAEMLQLASSAPSGRNTQPVEWRVLYDRDEVRRLAGLVIDWMRHVMQETPEFGRSMHLDRLIISWDAGKDRICRGAPHVIIAHAPKENRAAQASCTIALTYLELAAPAFGLGACWAGYFNSAANLWPPMADTLQLPQGHSSFGAMMLGYPKYGFHRIPRRKAPVVSWSDGIG